MKTSGISNFLKLLVSAVTTWVFAAFLFGFTRVWGIETLPAFERVLPFDLSRLLIQLMILGLATGIPFAIVDFILNHGWFNRQKYWFIILVKTVIQVVIAVFSVSILAFVSTNFFEMTTVNIIDFVLSPNTLLWIIFSGIVSSIIYFLQVIRTKVGSRILINLLLGIS